MRDEWIIGQSIDGDRDYALHMRAPRFVVEIASDEDGAVRPVEIEFLDGDPEGNVAQCLEDAADAFVEWEKNLEEDMREEDEG